MRCLPIPIYKDSNKNNSYHEEENDGEYVLRQEQNRQAQSELDILNKPRAEHTFDFIDETISIVNNLKKNSGGVTKEANVQPLNTSMVADSLSSEANTKEDTSQDVNLLATAESAHNTMNIQQSTESKQQGFNDVMTVGPINNSVHAQTNDNLESKQDETKTVKEKFNIKNDVITVGPINNSAHAQTNDNLESKQDETKTVKKKFSINNYEFEKDFESGLFQVKLYKHKSDKNKKVVGKRLKDFKQSYDLEGAYKTLEKKAKAEQYVIRKFRHPNIISFKGFSNDKNAKNKELFMEAGDRSLADEFVRDRSASKLNKEAVEGNINRLYLIQRALSFLHENKLAHCDVKPANIVLCLSSTRNKRQWVPKLIDILGYAGLAQSGVGTKGFIPESSISSEKFRYPYLLKRKKKEYANRYYEKHAALKESDLEEFNQQYEKDVVEKEIAGNFNKRAMFELMKERDAWALGQIIQVVLDTYNRGKRQDNNLAQITLLAKRLTANSPLFWMKDRHILKALEAIGKKKNIDLLKVDKKKIISHYANYFDDYVKENYTD